MYNPCYVQVVEGLGIKEGDLLEFELTLERNLKVTVMKSTTQVRKPKKMAPAELQATLAKKKAFRGLTMDLTRGLMVQGSQEVMSELLLPAAAAAAAQGLPIRLPDPNQVFQPPVTLALPPQYKALSAAQSSCRITTKCNIHPSCTLCLWALSCQQESIAQEIAVNDVLSTAAQGLLSRSHMLTVSCT